MALKYFINLEKAYESNGRMIVQGIASGSELDAEQQRISKRLLNRFADKINGNNFPLTNGHQKGGAVDDELGFLNYAELLESGDNYELFVRGELDIDNPLSLMIFKKLQKGKKYAFSIEGLSPIIEYVYDNKLGKYIEEIVDAIPRAITITTKPSYAPSYLEVLQKSQELTKVKASGYSDYPDSAVNNAKKVLEWKEKYGSEVNGMTVTGWARARQIASRKPISRADLGSISSFKRHEKNSKLDAKLASTPWKDAGYVAWLGWGGSSMINWASQKLNNINKNMEKSYEKGNMVSWNSSGSQTYGRIKRVIKEGVYTPPNSSFEFKAENDNPVYVIDVTDQNGKSKGITVAHREDALQQYIIKSFEKTMNEGIKATEAGETDTTIDAEIAENVEVSESAESVETTEETTIENDSSEEKIEEISKSMEEMSLEKMYKLMKTMDERISKMEKMYADRSEMKKSSDTDSEITKAITVMSTVIKSIAEDVEAIKELPLQKRSKIVRKSYDELVDENKPKTLTDAIAQTL